jgi:ribosomal protein S18 acetylase RimI-like enzyme
MEITIRAARWPDDQAALGQLDTSFLTDRVYRVEREELAFRLVPEAVDPPLRKSYGSLADCLERLRRLRHVVVAEVGGEVVGLATAEPVEWSRRVEVEYFFVAPAARGRGVGRALMESVVGFARAAGAPLVWLETQNVNYPAVQFYRRLGFRICGLDERLYDPRTPTGEETALFLALEL